MAERIFTLEEAEDSLEAYLGRHSRRSHAIYGIVVGLLLAALAALPVVRVSVSVGAAGVLRPALDLQEVRAAVGGEAAEVRVARGAAVARGDPLLVLEAAEVEGRVRTLGIRAADIDRSLGDLRHLIPAKGVDAIATVAVADPELFQERDRLLDELRANALRLDQALAEAQRLGALAGRGLVSRQESERAERAVASVRAEGALTLARQRAAWEARRASLERESDEVRLELARLEEELARHTIVASASGTVEDLRVEVAGAYVQPGQVVATISPDERMVAEVFASPGDVGLLHRGMPVRLLVDAFNYRDWGHLTGRVEEISADYVVIDGRPAFRVAVAVEEGRLALPSGVEGRLRKGMTLQARFVLADRSLLQLLRDDVEDWLNPVRARAVEAG